MSAPSAYSQELGSRDGRENVTETKSESDWSDSDGIDDVDSLTDENEVDEHGKNMVEFKNQCYSI